MQKPNKTKRFSAAAAALVLSGAAIIAGAEATALVDVNGLFRVLDVLDAWPF